MYGTGSALMLAIIVAESKSISEFEVNDTKTGSLEVSIVCNVCENPNIILLPPSTYQVLLSRDVSNVSKSTLSSEFKCN